jgi:hypothetical protein
MVEEQPPCLCTKELKRVTEHFPAYLSVILVHGSLAFHTDELQMVRCEVTAGIQNNCQGTDLSLCDNLHCSLPKEQGLGVSTMNGRVSCLVASWSCQ